MSQFQAQRCQNSHFVGIFNGILQFEISWKMMKISDNANIASSQRSLELYKAAKSEWASEIPRQLLCKSTTL